MWEASWYIVLIVAAAANPAAGVDDLTLEPCINGAVSARGTHANQVAENISRHLDVPPLYDSTDLPWNPALIAEAPRKAPSPVDRHTRYWWA